MSDEMTFWVERIYDIINKHTDTDAHTVHFAFTQAAFAPVSWCGASGASGVRSVNQIGKL